jgi:hypothetical protein
MAFKDWLAQGFQQFRAVSPRPSSVPQHRSVMRTSTDWLWTCGGECFGYRVGDQLFTSDGREAGRFTEGDEVYGPSGDYLGEVRKVNRLVTNISKRKWNRDAFVPQLGNRFVQAGRASPIEIRDGFEDFPLPKQIDSQA